MAPVYSSLLSTDTIALTFVRLSLQSPAEACPERTVGAPLEVHAGPTKPLAYTTVLNAAEAQERVAGLNYCAIVIRVELASLQPDSLLRKWRLRTSERCLWLNHLGKSSFAQSCSSSPDAPRDGAKPMDNIYQTNAYGTGPGIPLNSSTFCQDSPYARLVLGDHEHQPAPTTSTKGGARKTTSVKYRCILALSPASCRICRPNSPSTFPDIAHLREHIYRCGVYCECGEKVLAFKSAAEHHDHSGHGFRAVAGPSNRWPHNTCLPFEVLKAINTADTTHSSRRHHFQQLDDDGQRWVSIWCTITDFYHQHTGDPRWDRQVPWPYDTPQTAMERSQSTPSRPSRLTAPNMISSQSMASNASFTTTSDLSAAQYSFTDSAPAGHLPHTYGPTTFTGATSEPPAEVDAMFGLSADGLAQPGPCPAQEDFPAFPIDIDVPTDMTNYTGQHEYVNRELDLPGGEDILGFLHPGPRAIQQIPSALPAMANTRSSMRGGLVPLSNQSDLAWRDAYTGSIRPLPELEQNELIAIIEYQYSELRRRQN